MDTANARIDSALLQLLACPDCKSQLISSDYALRCLSCDAQFSVSNGVPLLLPKDVDREHLAEEEAMAHMMSHKEADPDMRFNLNQWDQSKIEFWRMVRSQMSGDQQRIVNIGCGNDPNHASLLENGRVVVNLEIVFSMLEGLQQLCPSGHYVNGDLKHLPFRPNSFDGLISIDVIHHECDQLEELFTTWHSLLKPGGMLFLEDPNAWGLFQMAKSIFLPQAAYRTLRKTYHTLLRSEHHPADYEFPTNVWKIKSLLRKLGFEQIRLYPHTAYPTISAGKYRLYKLLSGSEYVRTYHNYHYMLSAVRS